MSSRELPTVLIVDDDKINRAVLSNLLAGECRLILAKDGPSALQRLIEMDVSLVLLDISMPAMDGYEVLRRIKADHRTSHISVIFITGQSGEEDEEKGLLLGAADFVSKPIRPAIVRARIRTHLKFAMQRRELEQLSAQDSLTGIANRRRFDEVFRFVYGQAARQGESIGVAMIDVDYFKQYNDCYGHGAGDDALCRIANVLAASARRPHDLVARYGGEEFVLLHGDAGDFEASLEQIRAEVAALNIPHIGSSAADVLTISAGGLITWPAPKADHGQLLQGADRLLYRAKVEGRNCVRVENYEVETGA